MLKQISAKISCNGFYVFTIKSGRGPLIHGRMFAPASGILEDPVTGNANGPLDAYLVKYGLVRTNGYFLKFEATQGEKINRAGKMIVQVDIVNTEPVKIRIVGNAIIAFHTEICL